MGESEPLECPGIIFTMETFLL